LPVPVLALIQGRCYAGALEVCLACDLIWAAEGSQIGQIEAVADGIPTWPKRDGTAGSADREGFTLASRSLKLILNELGISWR
jgi:hypothetical protein